MSIEIKSAESCKYDIVSLGEIMLRLDPGEGRIRTARGSGGLSVSRATTITPTRATSGNHGGNSSENDVCMALPKNQRMTFASA